MPQRRHRGVHPVGDAAQPGGRAAAVLGRPPRDGQQGEQKNSVRPGRPYGRVGGVFAGLGIAALLVLLATLPATADRVVLDWLAAHRTGSLTGVLRVVSALGGITMMGLLAVVIATAAGAAARSWRPVAFVAAAVVGSAVLAAAVKAVVDRPRPPVTQALVAANGPGFPSEHAVRAVVVLGAGAVPAGRAGRRRMRTALAAGAAVLALLVGFSRVYLGVHRPSDVVAGAVLGFGWLLAARAAAGLYDRDRPARRRVGKSRSGSRPISRE